MVERNPWLSVLSHAVMWLGVAIVAFPLYLAFVASSHTPQDIVQAPMPLLPGGHLWETYKTALLGGGDGAGSTAPVARMMWVSFVTAMVIAVGKIAKLFEDALGGPAFPCVIHKVCGSFFLIDAKEVEAFNLRSLERFP